MLRWVIDSMQDYIRRGSKFQKRLERERPACMSAEHELNMANLKNGEFGCNSRPRGRVASGTLALQSLR